MEPPTGDWPIELYYPHATIDLARAMGGGGTTVCWQVTVISRLKPKVKIFMKNECPDLSTCREKCTSGPDDF